MDENLTCEALQESLDRQKAHFSKMQKIVREIDAKIAEIAGLKYDVKSANSELEDLQRELVELVKNGADEQRKLPIEIWDSENTVVDDAWKSRPVADLPGLTENEIEKLSAEFETCGEVCEWVDSDFSRKVSGIGDKIRDKIKASIDKIAGVTDDAIKAEAERGKAEREKLETGEGITATDAEYLLAILKMKYYDVTNHAWNMSADASGDSGTSLKANIEWLFKRHFFHPGSVEHNLLQDLSEKSTLTNDMVQFFKACKALIKEES